jgi:hypothetical protein
MDSVARLDEAITIVSARSAVALAVLIVLVGAALAWGVFGSIPIVVEAHGVFVSGAGAAHIGAADDGTIEMVEASVGEAVKRGQAIARERVVSGQIVALRAPRDGTVIEIVGSSSLFVHRGDVIASIVPAGEPLHAVVFVPVAIDRRVEPGMAATIVPADTPSLGGRSVRAKVAAVAGYPATAARIRNALQDDALAAQFSAAEPVREITLALDRNADGSLAWNGLLGPGPVPAGGTPALARIIVRERHPLEIVFSESQ